MRPEDGGCGSKNGGKFLGQGLTPPQKSLLLLAVFPPEPFLEVFVNSLTELHHMTDLVQHKIAELQERTRLGEQEHKETLLETNRLFEVTSLLSPSSHDTSWMGKGRPVCADYFIVFHVERL